MGELANILSFPQPLPRPPAPEPQFGAPLLEPARLVPGCARSGRKKPARPVGSGDAEFALSRDPDSHFLLQSFARIRPYAFATAAFDVLVISSLFWVMPRVPVLSGAQNSWVVFVSVFLLAAGRFRLYKVQPLRLRQSALIKTLLLATGLATLSLRSFSTAKIAQTLLLSAVVAGFLMLSRELQDLTLQGPHPRRNALVIGPSALRAQISEAIEHDTGLVRSVKAFLPDEEFRDIRGPASLRRIARRHCIEELVIASRDLDLAEEIFLEARRNHLDVTFALPFQTASIEVEPAGAGSLLNIHQQNLPEWQLAAKRTSDIVIALAGLILLSPLLAVIGLLIRLDSPGPAIYRAIRIGLRGRKFVCYKFRTMFRNADATKEQLRALNERHGAFFKISNDPRITRIGRLLRRYSLDELPQLFNVLRGEMSLVGPRPHPADDVDGYRLEDMQRLDAAPGMTGLWQVSARQDPSFDRCVELDVEYIKRWTPLLDLRILFQTISCVFQGSGV